MYVRGGNMKVSALSHNIPGETEGNHENKISPEYNLL
jgi:hypothetical protein